MRLMILHKKKKKKEEEINGGCTEQNKWDMCVIGNMASMHPTSILHVIKIDGDPWAKVTAYIFSPTHTTNITNGLYVTFYCPFETITTRIIGVELEF